MGSRSGERALNASRSGSCGDVSRPGAKLPGRPIEPGEHDDPVAGGEVADPVGDGGLEHRPSRRPPSSPRPALGAKYPTTTVPTIPLREAEASSAISTAVPTVAHSHTAAAGHRRRWRSTEPVEAIHKKMASTPRHRSGEGNPHSIHIGRVAGNHPALAR